ncbi:hypothetical protein PIB30_020060 [Stylosanthes scabra]|uniref:Uncharacterized protein n=1 Tax=Stylosanthes scabra TaxID=79078 RepID=A0ABU6U7A6_9FABA|nr:hypothetical protein [Stylosanthes scabra]
MALPFTTCGLVDPPPMKSGAALLPSLFTSSLSIVFFGVDDDSSNVFPCRIVDPLPMKLQVAPLPSLFTSSSYLVYFGSDDGNNDVFSCHCWLLFLLPCPGSGQYLQHWRKRSDGIRLLQD